uniref:protein-serine/threonine phosphatase n=1 Tax=Electrophorus electricus TaxID=8005 RepID=A0A4W4GXN8_ELEEL
MCCGQTKLEFTVSHYCTMSFFLFRAVHFCSLTSEDSVLYFCCARGNISESFLTVKGAALFLPRGNGSSSSSCSSRITGQRSKHAGDLQQHLQTMFTLLRPEDNIRLAVKLESMRPHCTRYMVVVSTNGRQDTEESVVLGMDFSPSDSSCSIGLVLPLWSDTLIHLDGDGGFSVSTDNRIHVFKPVSVQAMWSALQSLHKACEVARCNNYFPGSLFLTWVSYYQSRMSSDQAHINEWNTMQDVQSHRADSPVLFSDVPTERERTERLIKTRLREIMMQKDLENVTSKEIRTELEMQMGCNLREFKEYIDNEMIVILGQMDSPTEIFEHVYLGSEWNASNLEELQNSGVQYILNVTREIDNFFPGLFEYHNIRVYDEEATDLLACWNDTYKFISRAKKAGAKCLVHCKMGVSRSASTVIAYAMKEYGWDLERAFVYVKKRRAVTKPNPSFMRQLEEYQGILLASRQRHNKLWRSHSDSDLSEHHEPLVKTSTPQTLGRSNPRNQSASQASPSLQDLLQVLTPPEVPCLVPEEKYCPQVTRTEPVRGRTSEPSRQVLGSSSVAGLSTHVPELGQKFSQQVPDTDVDCAGLGHTSDDDQNHLSATLQEAGLSTLLPSALSSDSINFFSAREKFLGLSQEGQSRGSSEQAVQQTSRDKSPSQESRLLLSENPLKEMEEEKKVRYVHNSPLKFSLLITSTDSPSEDRLAVDMRETWETLKELGAFLCKVCGESKKWLSHPWADKYQKKLWTVRERAREVEAKVRQAGLTPPSLIKRSASLAKLGSLELSANDLSELELSPASVLLPTTKPRPHSFTDDTSKKKRVLPRLTPCLPSSCISSLSPAGSHMDERLDCQTGEAGNSDDDQAHIPLRDSPPYNQCWRQGKVPDPASTPGSALISMVTRQQYEKTHPLRKLKKRALNVPYHTM